MTFFAQQFDSLGSPALSVPEAVFQIMQHFSSAIEDDELAFLQLGLASFPTINRPAYRVIMETLRLFRSVAYAAFTFLFYNIPQTYTPRLPRSAVKAFLKRHNKLPLLALFTDDAYTYPAFLQVAQTVRPQEEPVAAFVERCSLEPLFRHFVEVQDFFHMVDTKQLQLILASYYGAEYMDDFGALVNIRKTSCLRKFDVREFIDVCQTLQFVLDRVGGVSHFALWVTFFFLADTTAACVLQKGQLKRIFARMDISAKGMKFERLLHSIDLNQDGVVQLDEYIQFLVTYQSAPTVAPLQILRSLTDKQPDTVIVDIVHLDGVVSENEYIKALNTSDLTVINHNMPTYYATVFDQVDTAGTERISRAEFIAAFRMMGREVDEQQATYILRGYGDPDTISKEHFLNFLTGADELCLDDTVDVRRTKRYCQLSRIFRSIDANVDRHVGEDEALAYFFCIFPDLEQANVDTIRLVYRLCNVAADGRMTFEEFIDFERFFTLFFTDENPRRVFLEFVFNVIDTNKNGFFEDDEFLVVFNRIGQNSTELLARMKVFLEQAKLKQDYEGFVRFFESTDVQLVVGAR